MGLDRRAFLRATAGATALAGLAACTNRGASETRRPEANALIDPRDAPFDHVVVLTLPDRSFDHRLGWLGQADGRQRGLAYRDANGDAHTTHDLGLGVRCGPPTPPHEWTDAAVQLGDDTADGFLRTVAVGDLSPLGYYTRSAVPVTARLATTSITLGNYFAALNAGAVPNRMYLHCAATDLDVDGRTAVDVAIWDRLLAAGLTGRCYCAGVPFIGRFPDDRYASIVRPLAKLATDARAGRLPNVAFIEPDPADASDLRASEATIASVHRALRRAPSWGRTVLIVHHDQGGGYFDHVPPPKVIDSNVNPNVGPHPDYSQLGFRVPCIVVSPFAPPGVVVGGEPFEHTSILRMIEWRWALPPLSVRDRNARNLADVLDFSRVRSTIGPVEYSPPPGSPCREPA